MLHYQCRADYGQQQTDDACLQRKVIVVAHAASPKSIHLGALSRLSDQVHRTKIPHYSLVGIGRASIEEQRDGVGL
jgi:hypothetical protein